MPDEDPEVIDVQYRWYAARFRTDEEARDVYDELGRKPFIKTHGLSLFRIPDATVVVIADTRDDLTKAIRYLREVRGGTDITPPDDMLEGLHWRRFHAQASGLEFEHRGIRIDRSGRVVPGDKEQNDG